MKTKQACRGTQRKHVTPDGLVPSLWTVAQSAAKGYYANSPYSETVRKQREYSYAMGYYQGMTLPPTSSVF